MVDAMKPFVDDATVLQVGGITIENGIDRVSLSGSLDFGRDRQGLDHARALRAALDAIVSVLEADEHLPTRAAPSKRAGITKAPNPFA